jgi:PhnB protein
MAKKDRYQQLDAAVQALLARPAGRVPQRRLQGNAQLAALVRLAEDLRGLPRIEFREQLKKEMLMSTAPAPQTAATSSKEAVKLRTVTPYIVALKALELVEFYKNAFGALVNVQGKGSAGGYHIEVELGDSMLMVGGGGEFRGPELPTALWYFVEDTDAVYRRALDLGATSISEPVDQPYGDREAGIKDLAGNNWYISTHRGARYIREGMATITPYLHPRSGAQQIDFLERAFQAQVLERHADPDGAVRHALLRVGDSRIALGEARGPYQPMPTMFYLNVDGVDTWYQRAVEAGAAPMHAPASQPYGARVGAVKDPFDNQWWISEPAAQPPDSRKVER